MPTTLRHRYLISVRIARGSQPFFYFVCGPAHHIDGGACSDEGPSGVRNITLAQSACPSRHKGEKYGKRLGINTTIPPRPALNTCYVGSRSAYLSTFFAASRCLSCKRSMKRKAAICLFQIVCYNLCPPPTSAVEIDRASVPSPHSSLPYYGVSSPVILTIALLAFP